MNPKTMDFKDRKLVREVTDEEVAFYEKHGWVKLDGFIPREVTADLLKASEDLKNVVDRTPTTDTPKYSPWAQATYVTKTIEEWFAECYDFKTGAQLLQAWVTRKEPFQSVFGSGGFGRAAHRLINRRNLTDDEIGVRMAGAVLWCKSSPSSNSDNGTYYHQDYCNNLGVDRVGSLMIWVALDEVTPEQGAMRFLDGSHRAGPLGTFSLPGAMPLLNRYPKLLQHYPLTPPLHYQPGDATVHHTLMVHGAPPNSTTKPRWNFTLNYTPDDSLMFTCSSLGTLGDEHPVVYP